MPPELHTVDEIIAAMRESGQLDTLVEAEIAKRSGAGKQPGTLGDVKLVAEMPIGLDDPTAGFACVSEFAKQVRAAELSQGRSVDPRLAVLDSMALAKAAGDGLEEGDYEEGGYLVPPEYSTQLLERAIEVSNFVSRCTPVPMQRNRVGMPYLKDSDHSGGFLFTALKLYWADELDETTASKPKFGYIELALKKLIGMVYASDELLQDSPISMEPLLTKKFSDAFAWHLDWVLLNGTGAGMPLGMLHANNPSLLAIDAEDGQEAKTILYENIIKLYARLPATSQGRAIFIANRDTFVQLASMVIPVGVGGIPAYLPANGIAGRPFDTLMGLPLIFTEHCQTLGTKGDVALVDFSEYLLGQKAGAGSGIEFAVSIHLKFDYGQKAFRYMMRLDGQPAWPTTMKPRYSSDHLSPSIVIASRT